MEWSTAVQELRARGFGFSFGRVDIIEKRFFKPVPDVLKRVALYGQIEIEAESFPLFSMATRHT